MDTVFDMLSLRAGHLIARASGPLNFRLFVMPTVVTILAILAGLKDARQGQPPFFWSMLVDRAERPRLFRSARKDIGRVLIVALVMDTIYQLLVLKFFYVGQALIVAVACAILPYVLVRGPVTRLARRFRRAKDALPDGHPGSGTPNERTEP